jgi:iron-regulated transporter 1
MALSRIGLWSFDLAQLTQLQKDLEHHPRQNVLTALQIALQNVFTLGAYGLTLGWNKPRDFKFAAVVRAGCSFNLFLRSFSLCPCPSSWVAR